MRNRTWLLALAVVLLAVQFAGADGSKKKRTPAAGQKTVAELIEDLKGSDDERENAVILLTAGPRTRLTLRELAPTLRRLIQEDANEEIRKQAQLALALIEGDRAALRRFAQDDASKGVRRQAQSVLTALGREKSAGAPATPVSPPSSALRSAPPPPQVVTKILKLARFDPDEAKAVLKSFAWSQDLRIATDRRSSTVLVRGNQRDLDVAAEIIAVLDRQPLSKTQIVKAYALK
jgi:hypothetical protein